MASGRNEAIFAALREHLGIYADANSYRVALEGVDFPGTGKTKPDTYLATYFRPNRTNTRTHGGEPQHKRGILQVSVCFRTGSGTAQGYAIADEIVGHFSKNTTLWNGSVKVGIYQEPWSSAPTEDGSYFSLPVTIPYECGN